MISKQTRGFRLRFAGVCVLLLAVVFIFIPKKYQQSMERLFFPEKTSGTERSLHTKTDRSGDSHSRNRVISPRRDPKQWFAEVRARNPGLEPAWRQVPDHENGFLQWLLFCEKHKGYGKPGSENLDIPSDIAEILSHPEKWDSQVVKTFLDENKDLLESIARIGLLPSQSAAGIDVNRWSFVGARFTKQCAELLLADARLAAEAGDFERALRQVKAASGLANHYDQIEAHSLLMETVSLLVRLNVQEQVMKYLLPALDSTPGEIAQWREAIRPPNMELSGFSSILRGEGWVSLGGLVIPLVNGDMGKSFPSQDYIPDPDAFFDAFAQGYIETANRAKALSLDELIGGEGDHIGFQFPTDHLSAEARKMLESELFSIGFSAWAKGWTRGMVLAARTDAALAIIQGEAVPLERFTGLPYVYDPVARTVQVPNDPRLREKLEIGRPLQLPR